MRLRNIMICRILSWQITAQELKYHRFLLLAQERADTPVELNGSTSGLTRDTADYKPSIPTPLPPVPNSVDNGVNDIMSSSMDGQQQDERTAVESEQSVPPSSTSGTVEVISRYRYICMPANLIEKSHWRKNFKNWFRIWWLQKYVADVIWSIDGTGHGLVIMFSYFLNRCQANNQLPVLSCQTIRLPIARYAVDIQGA